MNCCNNLRPLLLYMLLAACRLNSLAQEPADSCIILFQVDDLYYHSAFEYKVFDELEDGIRDYLALITCINPKITEREVDIYRKWIVEIAASIRQERSGRLNEEKMINAINSYFTGNLLVQYDQLSAFDDLYRSGRYNFITAASLYALIMDELQIPYILKESSSHLYLLAYPLTEKIIVETTIPEYRYLIFDHTTRTSFVKYLRDNNLIDEITYRSKTTKELFEKYFFPQKDFTLKELSGLQYMHKAMQDIEYQDHKSAYLNLQKAYYLYPSYKVQYMLLAEYYTFLDSCDFTSSENLAFLIAGPGLIPIGFNPDYFLKRFGDITGLYLFEREDVNEYSRIYRFLFEQAGDQHIKEEISFLYFYETGRYYNNSGKFELALDNLERAYDIKPSDKNMQELLVRALAGYAATTGSSELIPRLEYYDEEYKIDERYDIFVMVKMHTFLQYAGESFQVQDAAAGEAYLSKFEKLHKDNPDIGIDQYLIGRSYSSAAIYYFRKGDVERSKQLVWQGLQFAPDNVELRLKRDSFKE